MALSYEQYLPGVDKVYLTGGGAHHPLLNEELKQLVGDEKVEPLGAVRNLTVDSKEAVAFAVLAHERLNNVPTNVPSVTGARKKTTLGKLSIPLTIN